MATKRQVDQPHPVERVPSVSLENNTSLQEWERSSPHKKNRKILASCKTPLLTLPSKKGRKGGQLEARAQETLEETEAHSLENEDEPDYSNFGLFREFLTNKYLRNGFFQPPAVLELSSGLVPRCTVIKPTLRRDRAHAECPRCYSGSSGSRLGASEQHYIDW